MPNAINDTVQAQIAALKAGGIWAQIAADFVVSNTYTPDFYGASTHGTTTWAAGYPVGAYIRLGSWVFVTGTLSWTNATGTGIALVSLPLVVAPGNIAPPATVMTITLTTTLPSVTLLATPAQSYAILYSSNPLTGALTTENVKTSGALWFSIAYQTV
jgi:hypothetical protein